MSAAQELSEVRRFALLPIHEFLRDNALDLSSPLIPETLSNRALLSALRRTFLLLVADSDFALVQDALINDQNSLDASTLSDRKDRLRALLIACEQFHELPNGDEWRTSRKSIRPDSKSDNTTSRFLFARSITA
jgi:hypothetical protein